MPQIKNKKIFEDFDPTWREAPLMTAQPSLLLPRLCKREKTPLVKKGWLHYLKEFVHQVSQVV